MCTSEWNTSENDGCEKMLKQLTAASENYGCAGAINMQQPRFCVRRHFHKIWQNQVSDAQDRFAFGNNKEQQRIRNRCFQNDLNNHHYQSQSLGLILIHLLQNITSSLSSHARKHHTMTLHLSQRNELRPGPHALEKQHHSQFLTHWKLDGVGFDWARISHAISIANYRRRSCRNSDDRFFLCVFLFFHMNLCLRFCVWYLFCHIVLTRTHRYTRSV